MRSTARVPVVADPVVDALRAEVQALTARIEALERGRGPRDHFDQAWLEVLAELADSFQAADVIERGRLDAEFRALLLAADIESAEDVGYALRRPGIVINGRELSRVGRNARGAIWQWLTI